MKKSFIAILCIFGAMTSAQQIEITNKEKSEEKVQQQMVISDKSKEKTKPLYYLDGEEVAEGILTKIDPSTIESVSVLKDKSAVAIYGERARDGVIIINSKRKAEADTITISR